MANELKDIATSFGYGARVTRMPWGGGSTDAASFGQQGIEATCLLAFEIDITKLKKTAEIRVSNLSRSFVRINF